MIGQGEGWVGEKVLWNVFVLFCLVFLGGFSPCFHLMLKIIKKHHHCVVISTRLYICIFSFVK